MAGKAELTVAIKGDNTGLKRALEGARQQTSAFASGQLRAIAGTVAAAFSVGAIASWAKEVAKTADDIQDVSRQLGLTTDQYQALTAVATKQGIASENVTAKLFKLADAQGDVVNGNKTMADAFKRLGVTGDDVYKPLPFLLEKIARGVKDDATAVADLNAVFGKGAAGEFAEVLEGLSDQTFPDLIAQMKEAGMVMDKEIIAKFAEMQASMNMFWKRTSVAAAEGIMGLKKTWLDFASVLGYIAGESNFSKDPRGSSRLPSTRWMSAMNALGLGQIGAPRTPVAPAPVDNSAAMEEAQQIRERAAAAIELDKIQKDDLEKARKIEQQRDEALRKATVEAPQAADTMAAKGMFVGAQTNPYLQEQKLIAKYAEINAEYAVKLYEAITGGD